MSESKHTPGPWSVGPGKRWPEVLVNVGPKENPGNAIASVGMGGDGATSMEREKIEANARLIAAAPELMEALKACASLITDAKCIQSVKWTSARAAARAAIARAEGKP